MDLDELIRRTWKENQGAMLLLADRLIALQFGCLQRRNKFFDPAIALVVVLAVGDEDIIFKTWNQ